MLLLYQYDNSNSMEDDCNADSGGLSLLLSWMKSLALSAGLPLRTDVEIQIIGSLVQEFFDILLVGMQCQSNRE